jgi:predicted ATP-binding protein involved in virulence
MRIRSLNLHHWGPIKQLETQFNPEAKIIVLHATNGAGKSTFIRAIGNLLSWHRGGNTWGAQESISTGEESATLEMIVETVPANKLSCVKLTSATERPSWSRWAPRAH